MLLLAVFFSVANLVLLVKFLCVTVLFVAVPVHLFAFRPMRILFLFLTVNWNRVCFIRTALLIFWVRLVS